MIRQPVDLLGLILEHCAGLSPFAVVTVLRADGSTPVQAGAKAVVEATGAIRGTVGGGMIEAEAQRRAGKAIRDGRPLVFEFRMQGADAEAAVPICGGTMRVLVDPCARDHRAALAEASAALSRRERGVLVTTIHPSSVPEVHVRWWCEKELDRFGGGGASVLASRPTELLSALHREEAVLIEAPSPSGKPGELLVEPVVPKPLLLIAGGGHVGQAVAQQASLVGVDLVVVDEREEFCRPELFPEGTTTRCQRVPEAMAEFPFGDDTYVVIVTRGHAHDAEALAGCLGKPAAYVGMIGSRRKVALLRQDFLESGRATAEVFDRVYAPIGLDIGAVTVPEIATSIVSQLIAVRRTGHAPRMGSE
jgi:xanthine dehydrogenase accessory factor